MIQTENSPFSLPAILVCSLPEETINAGKRLALHLKKGNIVALRGPLGAGKTCFAKGIARGLGIREELTSPTYTIISEYEAILAEKNPADIRVRTKGGPGRNPEKTRETVPVFHIDAYRLSGNDDFSAMGGEEIVFGQGISIIEWSERIPDFIPKTAFLVDIELAEGGKRVIRIHKDSEEDFS